jgi:3-phenylpropionate/cinnamic acid dioxygenase small subunit
MPFASIPRSKGLPVKAIAGFIQQNDIFPDRGVGRHRGTRQDPQDPRQRDQAGIHHALSLPQAVEIDVELVARQRVQGAKWLVHQQQPGLQQQRCENKGMIRDRAFALKETAMFAPRYMRHLIANLTVEGEASDGTIAARANYVVLQVLFDRPDATLHQVGTYYDRFRRTAKGLKLLERRCVYDNLLVPNALCLPV